MEWPAFFSFFTPFSLLHDGMGGVEMQRWISIPFFRQALCCFYCFGFGMMDGWRIEFGLR